MRIPFFIEVSICFVILARISFAAMPEKDYMEALKLAEQKVLREKAAQLAISSSPGALSSTVIGSLYGHYYEKGDQWNVAAFLFDQTEARKISDPDYLKTKIKIGGIFHYEVDSVQTGAKPQVVLKVTQLSAYGLKPVDPHVESLSLTMNDQISQSEKAYSIQGASEPVKVSPEGIHSAITLLELFPLDVPELLAAKRGTLPSLPQLPDAAGDFAKQVGFKPDLSQSAWYEQDDFFGRPVEILWHHGDPWPAYIKTANGIAILIREAS